MDLTADMGLIRVYRSVAERKITGSSAITQTVRVIIKCSDSGSYNPTRNPKYDLLSRVELSIRGILC